MLCWVVCPKLLVILEEAWVWRHMQEHSSILLSLIGRYLNLSQVCCLGMRYGWRKMWIMEVGQSFFSFFFDLTVCLHPRFLIIHLCLKCRCYLGVCLAKHHWTGDKSYPVVSSGSIIWAEIQKPDQFKPVGVLHIPVVACLGHWQTSGSRRGQLSLSSPGLGLCLARNMLGRQMSAWMKSQ